MKSNQTIWLIVAAVTLYGSAFYCAGLVTATSKLAATWFGGIPLPELSQLAIGFTKTVAHYGVGVAGMLLAFAALSFWWSRNLSADDKATLSLVNTIGYYASRIVLVSLLCLSMLQTHGFMIAFLDYENRVKELGKTDPTLRQQTHKDNR